MYQQYLLPKRKLDQIDLKLQFAAFKKQKSFRQQILLSLQKPEKQDVNMRQIEQKQGFESIKSAPNSARYRFISQNGERNYEKLSKQMSPQPNKSVLDKQIILTRTQTNTKKQMLYTIKQLIVKKTQEFLDYPCVKDLLQKAGLLYKKDNLSQDCKKLLREYVEKDVLSNSYKTRQQKAQQQLKSLKQQKKILVEQCQTKIMKAKVQNDFLKNQIEKIKSQKQFQIDNKDKALREMLETQEKNEIKQRMNYEEILSLKNEIKRLQKVQKDQKKYKLKISQNASDILELKSLNQALRDKQCQFKQKIQKLQDINCRQQQKIRIQDANITNLIQSKIMKEQKEEEERKIRLQTEKKLKQAETKFQKAEKMRQEIEEKLKEANQSIKRHQTTIDQLKGQMSKIEDRVICEKDKEIEQYSKQNTELKKRLKEPLRQQQEMVIKLKVMERQNLKLKQKVQFLEDLVSEKN